jgi:hypothetical protein
MASLTILLLVPRIHAAIPTHPSSYLLVLRLGLTAKEQQGLALWITDPAGVGKSVIVQTFAEYLVNKLLGASVFFPQPNRHNIPHGVLITIAYQLSIRLEAYCIFITE